MSYPSVYPTGATVYKPEKCWNGYTLFQANETGALLIDMNGNGVQMWEGLHGFPNKLLPGGIVFGAATVWFHDPLLIKWKFSLVYWLMGISFLVSARFFGKNLIQAMIGAELSLHEAVWARLNLAWVLYFIGMGGLNLLIAYNFSENAWYNFKLFGSLGLTLLFALAQGIYLSRHLKEAPAPAAKNETPV